MGGGPRLWLRRLAANTRDTQRDLTAPNLTATLRKSVN